MTCQAFTVPWRAGRRPADLGLEGVSVLRTEKTDRKLRTGQLWGNAFTVRLRQVAAPDAAAAVLERLGRLGMPNYFGPQRFGRAQDNAARGRALLLGQRLPGRVDRQQRRLYLSAFQSLLFNRALAARLSSGQYARALLGDVLRKADTGGLFLCQDVAVDQPRVDALEVSPTGPMFGWKVKPVPTGAVGEAEAQLLAAEGLPAGALREGKGETEGARRPYAVPVGAVQVGQEGADLWLAFRLPRGSYATVLLDEVMKPEGLLGLPGQGQLAEGRQEEGGLVGDVGQKAHLLVGEAGRRLAVHQFQAPVGPARGDDGGTQQAARVVLHAVGDGRVPARVIVHVGQRPG